MTEKVDLQCSNCGAYVDLGQFLPQQILDDIAYLVDCVGSDDSRPFDDADLGDVKHRLLAIGLLSNGEKEAKKT